MRGESGRRERCEGRECRGRERGGARDSAPWLPPDGRLREGMTSGATVGITSGGTCEGGELALNAAMAEHSPATSLGVETRLLPYVSSVTCTEKEVLEGEVREQESQEQLV